MRILMVCLGNICRSPIAEGVLRQLANDKDLDWVIDSAGTESYHIGEAPHKYSQKVCLEHGVDISEQRARKFVAEDFDRFDKIYAMSDDVIENIERIAGPAIDVNKLDFFLNELYEDSNASVPDPWYGEEKDYKHVYEMIRKTCEAIIKKYS